MTISSVPRTERERRTGHQPHVSRRGVEGVRGRHNACRAPGGANEKPRRHTRGSVSRRVGIQGYQMAIVIWDGSASGFPENMARAGGHNERQCRSHARGGTTRQRQCSGLRAARKGTVFARRAVEMQGKGSVSPSFSPHSAGSSPTAARRPERCEHGRHTRRDGGKVLPSSSGFKTHTYLVRL